MLRCCSGFFVLLLFAVITKGQIVNRYPKAKGRSVGEAVRVSDPGPASWAQTHRARDAQAGSDGYLTRERNKVGIGLTSCRQQGFRVWLAVDSWTLVHCEAKARKVLTSLDRGTYSC
jgi:hypothetical protein